MKKTDISQFTVGMRVRKKSNCAFKSSFKINTISGFQVNEQDPKQRMGATFKEDTSVVGLHLLEAVA